MPAVPQRHPRRCEPLRVLHRRARPGGLSPQSAAKVTRFVAAPVLINARAAARPEFGGVERYARELARRLPELRPEAYVVARPRPRLVHRLGHAWEQGALPLLAARLRAAAILSPANVAPLAWPRNVVIIHDAAALRHPEWYARAYVAYQRALLPRLAQRATRVITDLSFSRAEIVELLGAPPEQVSVIAGGVDERFDPGADSAGAAAALGFEHPYALTVGSLIARKNLAILEPAARELAARGGRARRRGRRSAAAAGRARRARGQGAWATSTTTCCPASTRARGPSCSPSQYEGFGLTLRGGHGLRPSPSSPPTGRRCPRPAAAPRLLDPRPHRSGDRRFGGRDGGRATAPSASSRRDSPARGS